jgi:hypothetical protein
MIRTGQQYEVLEPMTLMLVVGQIMASVAQSVTTGTELLVEHAGADHEAVVVEMRDGTRLALEAEVLRHCCRRIGE